MTTEPPTEIMLEALQEHIKTAMADQSLPPLRVEQFRAQLTKVSAARERMLRPAAGVPTLAR